MAEESQKTGPGVHQLRPSTYGLDYPTPHHQTYILKLMYVDVTKERGRFPLRVSAGIGAHREGDGSRLNHGCEVSEMRWWPVNQETGEGAACAREMMQEVCWWR
jgi:hypothetical protein